MLSSQWLIRLGDLELVLLRSQARPGSSARFIKARFEPELARYKILAGSGKLGLARAR